MPLFYKGNYTTNTISGTVNNTDGIAGTFRLIIDTPFQRYLREQKAAGKDPSMG